MLGDPRLAPIIAAGKKASAVDPDGVDRDTVFGMLADMTRLLLAQSERG